MPVCEDPRLTNTDSLHINIKYTRCVKKLIINADDFGDAPFTQGILEAHANGPLTSATVLVNVEGAKEAIVAAKEQDLSLGLHLNFTHGTPLSGGEPFLGRDEFRQALEEGRVDTEEIAREAEAQLSWFMEHAGTPTHIDGHHHVHILQPVLDVLAPLMVKRGVKRMRTPYGVPGADEAKAICDSHRIRTNDSFIGLGFGWERCTVEKLKEVLRTLDKGVTEYMVHLAHPEDAPEGSEIAGRAKEYATLMHPRILEVIQEEGIELVSYANV